MASLTCPLSDIQLYFRIVRAWSEKNIKQSKGNDCEISKNLVTTENEASIYELTVVSLTLLRLQQARWAFDSLPPLMAQAGKKYLLKILYVGSSSFGNTRLLFLEI